MTKEEKMREIFYRFLKKRKAYGKFMRNLNIKGIAVKGVKKRLEERYLRDAFSWAFSPEGGVCWSRLNIEWIEILEQLKPKTTKEIEEYRKFLGEN